MAFVQRAIIFIDTEILQISIGCIAVECSSDRRLFIENAIGHLGKAGVDAGNELAERTTHSITGTVAIKQLVLRTTKEDGTASHGLCQKAAYLVFVARQISLPGLLCYLYLSCVGLASADLVSNLFCR